MYCIKYLGEESELLPRRWSDGRDRSQHLLLLYPPVVAPVSTCPLCSVHRAVGCSWYKMEFLAESRWHLVADRLTFFDTPFLLQTLIITIIMMISLEGSKSQHKHSRVTVTALPRPLYFSPPHSTSLHCTLLCLILVLHFITFTFTHIILHIALHLVPAPSVLA